MEVIGNAFPRSPKILELVLSFSYYYDFDGYLFDSWGYLAGAETYSQPEYLEYIFDYNATVFIYIVAYDGIPVNKAIKRTDAWDGPRGPPATSKTCLPSLI